MCGLTGVALHPDADNDARTLAAVVFNDLLVRTQTRGRHATGVAAYVNADKRVVTAKRAETASRFTQRKEYETLLNGLADGHVSHIIGHTRYATQGAAEMDENAHPFTFGAVTGAHNGIITNWRDIEKMLRNAKRKEASRGFRVDSEAAFALLNVHDTKPHKALEKLRGYFALTWLRGASLYFARTDAPLVLAYVKATRTLFWNSERRNLDAALALQGIDTNDADAVLIYEPTPGKVYRYTPALFATDGTNVAHGSTFNFEASHKGMNWARPTASGTTMTTTRRSAGGERVTTTKLAANGARIVSSTTSPRVVPVGTVRDVLSNTLGADKVYSFPELTRKLNEAGRRIIAGEKREREMIDRIDRLEKLARAFTASLDDDATPYRDTQLSFPGVEDVETFAREGGVCAECGFAGDTRNPLIDAGDGIYAHRVCAELAGTLATDLVDDVPGDDDTDAHNDDASDTRAHVASGDVARA